MKRRSFYTRSTSRLARSIKTFCFTDFFLLNNNTRFIGASCSPEGQVSLRPVPKTKKPEDQFQSGSRIAQELATLRQRIADLELLESELTQAEEALKSQEQESAGIKACRIDPRGNRADAGVYPCFPGTGIRNACRPRDALGPDALHILQMRASPGYCARSCSRTWPVTARLHTRSWRLPAGCGGTPCPPRASLPCSPSPLPILSAKVRRPTYLARPLLRAGAGRNRNRRRKMRCSHAAPPCTRHPRGGSLAPPEYEMSSARRPSSTWPASSQISVRYTSGSRPTRKSPTTRIPWCARPCSGCCARNRVSVSCFGTITRNSGTTVNGCRPRGLFWPAKNGTATCSRTPSTWSTRTTSRAT